MSESVTVILDDIFKIRHKAEARANALSDELLTVLLNAHAQLVALLAGVEARTLGGKSWEDAGNSRRKAFLEMQKAEVERLVGELFAEMEQPVLAATYDDMAYTTTRTVAALGFEASPFVGFTKPEVVAWAASTMVDGLVLNEWLGKMSRSTADRIVQAGREALVLGMGSAKAARHLKAKGIMGTVPQLETLARTYLLTASNFAGETAIERLDERTGSRLLKGWKYVATLDGRTCPVCGADDGKFFAKDQPRPRLARHGNCRCTYVPVARSWRDFGIDIPELAPVKRPAVKHDARLVHHRDGSTSTKFTPRSGEQTSENYNQWLTRQLHEDPAFVRGILGKTRFDLFQRGKITLEGMRVDGRVKRLVEL